MLWPIGVPFSDGLNTLSEFKVQRLDRQTWYECTSDNCLTLKGINGFTVMLNDDVPQMCGGKSMTPTSLGGTPVTIHLTVTDVDAKFQRALNAGATVVTALEDQLWGDRYGVVADPFGHHWSLGQPVREVNMDEIQAAMSSQGDG